MSTANYLPEVLETTEAEVSPPALPSLKVRYGIPTGIGISWIFARTSF